MSGQSAHRMPRENEVKWKSKHLNQPKERRRSPSKHIDTEEIVCDPVQKK